MRAMHSFPQIILLIVKKDLITEWRNRGLFSGMILFSIMVVLIFNFALELETKSSPALVSGIVWTTLVLTGVIGLNHTMPSEKESACLDGLLLAPVDRTALFFGKAVSIWIMMLIVTAILIPLLFILYGSPLWNSGLLATLVLGTAGYALSGTLLSTLSMQSRFRDLLLPVILLPVIFPLLLAAVKASNGFLQGLPYTEIETWVNLLLVYDAVFAGLGLMLFDTVIEE